MTLLETFALTITTALVKHILSQWLGSTWQSQVGQDFLDLLRDNTLTKGASKADLDQVNTIAREIVVNLDSWVRTELRGLEASERKSTVIEVARTLASVRIDAKVLVQERLDDTRIVDLLNERRPRATEHLSESATSLYRRLIGEIAVGVLKQAHTLSGYTVLVDAVQLSDHERILSAVEPITPILHTQTEYIQSLLSQSTVSSDPYADYLTGLESRISNFLNGALGDVSKDTGNLLGTLRLRYTVKPGLLDPKTEVYLEKDPLMTIIGKRYLKPQDTYDDLLESFRVFSGRLLLIGEPGAGKTISLLKFALEAIHRRKKDPNQPLPLLGVVPTWDYRTRPTISAWLQSSYGAPHDVAKIVDSGQALLLLDGLDELVPDMFDVRDPQYMFVTGLPENNKIILTCRSNSVHYLKGFIGLNSTLVIEPLTDQQISNFLQPFPNLSACVLANPHVKNLIQSPLFFSLFVETYHDALYRPLDEIGALGSTLDTRLAILQNCIRHRYDRACLISAQRLSTAYVELNRTLSRIAYRLLARSPIESAEENSTEFVPADLKQYIGEIPDAVIADALTLRLLVPTSDTKYRFSHPFFRDYLAFEGCKALIDVSRGDRGFNSTRETCYVIKRLDYEDTSNEKTGAATHEKLFVDACIRVLRNTPRKSDRHYNTVMSILPFERTASEVALLLLDDPEPSLRFDALFILANIETPELVLEPLLRVATSASAEFRVLAIEGLGRIGGARAIRGLIDVLDSNSKSALDAAETLIGMGESALGLVLDSLAQRIEDDWSYVLKESGNVDPHESTMGLLLAFESISIQSTKLLLAIYGAVRYPEHLAQQLVMIAKDGMDRMSELGVWLLIQACRTHPTPLIRLIRHGEREERLFAARMLRYAETEESIEALISALADRDKYVSYYACQTLIRIGVAVLDYRHLMHLDDLAFLSGDEDYDVVPELIAAANEERTPLEDFTRRHSLIVLTAIWCMMHIESIGLVIEALQASDSGTRYVAANTLVGLDTVAIEPLLVAYATGDEATRSSTGNILEHMGIDPALYEGNVE